MSSTPTETVWHKSSFYASGECAEIAKLSNGDIGLRNSRSHRTVLRFTSAEWEALSKGMKAGEFDDLA
jgi:hypothetical protein